MSTTVRPVTHSADVAVNNAVTTGGAAPVARARGSSNKAVPTMVAVP